MKDLSIYIHIPFCNKKCYYCDFVSYPNQFNRVEDYIHSLIMELSLYKDDLKEYKIKTIFIGGGTPSAIDANYINKVLDYIYINFNTYEDMEITIELNPGTLTPDKIKTYKEAGINRVSIGLQTFDDSILKKLGRIHSGKDFYDSYSMLKKAGFENINVDLIFGLPDQTLASGFEDLKKVVQLGVKHISYYSLIIEDGTPMHRWYQEDKVNLLDEDSERKLYHDVKNYLKENDYGHYEISNFSLEGYKCKHNLVYWKIKPYLGIGTGSHSYLNGKRFWNTSNLIEYIDSLNKKILPIEEEEVINKEIEIAEFCIFGLRLVEGINKKEFRKRFNLDLNDIYKDSIIEHKKSGLLIEDDNYLSLSERGRDLANIVEIDFLL